MDGSLLERLQEILGGLGGLDGLLGGCGVSPCQLPRLILSLLGRLLRSDCICIGIGGCEDPPCWGVLP